MRQKEIFEYRKKDYLDLFLLCLQKDFKYNIYIVPYLILTNPMYKLIVIKKNFKFIKRENCKKSVSVWGRR
jgi:hypothetical protein